MIALAVINIAFILPVALTVAIKTEWVFEKLHQVFSSSSGDDGSADGLMADAEKSATLTTVVSRMR